MDCAACNRRIWFFHYLYIVNFFNILQPDCKNVLHVIFMAKKISFVSNRFSYYGSIIACIPLFEIFRDRIAL